jgi:hypothetical protein
MFIQLHKELVRWTTYHNKMLMGIVKIDVKKDVCHFALVIKVLMQYFFLEKNPQY